MHSNVYINNQGLFAEYRKLGGHWQCVLGKIGVHRGYIVQLGRRMRDHLLKRLTFEGRIQICRKREEEEK